MRSSAARRVLDSDGQIVTIGGRDFEWGADENGAGWTCCTCDAYVGFGDAAVSDHLCENATHLAPAPLVRHYTSVAPAPNRQFAASCLCGWAGDPRPGAAQACTDANAHEGGTS